MVYMIWNQPPFAIVTKTTSGINTIKDFEGQTLGGAQGTPTTRLLPVFVQKNGLDGEKIKVSNMAPNLQEPMLIKGDIDARPGVQHHQLFQPRAEPPGSRQGLQVVHRSAITASISIPTA